jgi:hypothetical protein
MEYRVIEIGSRIAEAGVFILPQSSSPIVYSGVQCFEQRENKEYKKFNKATRIALEPGCGIDTAAYFDQWNGTRIMTEIVCTDFSEAIKPFRKEEQVGFDFGVAA